ncbi:glutaredoxin family protein [Pelomonas sp. APW6]|uniref:Glutaredoxin family protein n=1 Tax=Roseateles subflavus TaxID=3053353 RepID=A0ABT7LF57_9BURK|nr:glutaredoxin family protein [Pelomonas sp. APW6]MDL5031477.1 glutaredoxin family protein [Pelomonas sp. APW6]
MHRLLRRFGPALAIVALGLAAGYAAPRVPTWLRPAYTEGDYRAHFQGHAEPVLLYGTASCRYCKAARAYFQARRIPFADLDVQQDPEQQRRLQSLGEGQAVPVVLIGRRMIVGYQPEAFEAALAQLPP